MIRLHRFSSIVAGLALMLLAACAANSLPQDPPQAEENSVPNVASIYYYVSASQLYYEGDYASAAELYLRAQFQDPSSRQIRKQYLISSANAYLSSQSEPEPVLELFDNARDFMADDPELLSIAYSVYNEAEKPEGVAWAVGTLVDKFPSSRAYLQKFLLEYELQGKPSESYLKQAYKLARGKPDELLMIARIYTLADIKRSIAILKEVRALNGSPEATKFLGEYTLQHGYYKDAKELFGSFSYPADRTQMFQFLQQANKSRAYQPILELEPQLLATQDAELIAELSLAAYLEADYDALNRIFTALQAKYHEPIADAKIAVFLVAAALDSPAMEHPEQYLNYLFGALDADDIMLYRTLRISMANPTDHALLLKSWEADIMNRLPQSTWKDYLLAATKATTHADSLLISARIALCEELCDGTKGYESDYSYLLNHYHNSGQSERKFTLLRNALKRYPHNPLFLNDLGYSLLEFPDSLETAGKMIQNAVELEPDNAYYQDSIAWYYYLSGDFPKALDHIQIPLTLDPIPSEIAYHIGMILIANSNPTLAKDYLLKASLDEHNPVYRQKAINELEKMKNEE